MPPAKKKTEEETPKELTLEDKKKALDKYIKGVNKDLGDKVTIGFANELDLDYGTIVSPILALASLMGKDDGTPGGFPRGRITVIAGPEKSGKTTLCLQTLAAEMISAPNDYFLWVDTETSFDEDYARLLGIDFTRLLFITGGIMHDIMNRVQELSELGLIAAIVVDSVGGLTPVTELESSKGEKHGLEKTHMLDLQRKMGQFFRMINPYIAPKRIALVMIAHVYQDPGRQGAYVVKGGNALKHWGHVRLMVSRMNDQSTKQKVQMPDGNEKEVFIGHDVIIRLDKTRQNSKEGQSVVIPYRYGIGLDAVESTISVAINLGIVNRAGAWYTHKELKVQGRARVVEHFTSNKAEYNLLLNDITAHYELSKETEEVSDELNA